MFKKLARHSLNFIRFAISISISIQVMTMKQTTSFYFVTTCTTWNSNTNLSNERWKYLLSDHQTKWRQFFIATKLCISTIWYVIERLLSLLKSLTWQMMLKYWIVMFLSSSNFATQNVNVNKTIRESSFKSFFIQLAQRHDNFYSICDHVVEVDDANVIDEKKARDSTRSTMRSMIFETRKWLDRRRRESQRSLFSTQNCLDRHERFWSSTHSHNWKEWRKFWFRFRFLIVVEIDCKTRNIVRKIMTTNLTIILKIRSNVKARLCLQNDIENLTKLHELTCDVIVDVVIINVDFNQTSQVFLKLFCKRVFVLKRRSISFWRDHVRIFHDEINICNIHVHVRKCNLKIERRFLDRERRQFVRDREVRV